jgi:FAD:protein FMN transferase
MTASATSDPARPRLRHAEHVMGTVVSFDVAPGAAPAMAAAIRWLHWVDTTFSPYRDDSDVSRYGRGEASLAECAPELADVLEQAAAVGDVSHGYFTTTPGGRFDPSGFVKGWAVERAASILTESGWDSHCVNGGGDVRCVGSRHPGRPWRVGIAHPLRPGTLALVVAGDDFAVATSGVAERGQHIINPHTGAPATGLASVTVTGPSLTLADAYATAAFAMDGAARDWAESLDGYEAYAIAPDGSTWQTTGFAGYIALPPPRLPPAVARLRSVPAARL